MKVWIRMLLLTVLLVLPVSAMEFTAPSVPESARSRMPQEQSVFAEALLELVRKTIMEVSPHLREAASSGCRAVGILLLVSVFHSFGEAVKGPLNLVGAGALTATLLESTNAMLVLARDTVEQLSSYGKLLLPVMTGAMAAQGGITASAGLYMGTAFFDAVLGSLLLKLFVPLTGLFLALAVAGAASGEGVLKRLRELIRNGISWSLKTLLTVFTTYMSITGVVSGTTDAAALKATKMTISTMVPMVGGILSDASEAVLVGAGIMKNAAGIYGILALLAVFVHPFVRIGSHYLVLKIAAAIGSVFDSKGLNTLLEDFSSAMGMMLAVTGAMCLLQLISTVCFLKGVL